MQCVLSAWEQYESELKAWLTRQLANPAEAEDLLQDLFLKVLQKQQQFCQLTHPRAWLYQVARHALIDHYRLAHPTVELPEDLGEGVVELPPVEQLAQCLPRALAELPEAERTILTLCDLQGMKQDALAQHLGLSVSGAKSRLQRARQRLKVQLETACQIRYDESGQVCCFVPREPSPELN